ncbi:MAG TPA: hypothetical protein PK141_22040 [Polyangiaceae bacterium]|nr:hypothetical protein [Polyangiaceae bacterium]
MPEGDERAKKQERFRAFLEARLDGPEAAAEWRANLGRGYEELLTRPLGELLPREALLRLVEAGRRPEVYDRAVAKISKAVHAEAYPRVLRHDATLGRYVPAAGRAKIDALLGRPNLVNPKLVREVLAQEAMEDLMREVLFDALKEFNQNVNPFFAEWGIPGLIKKVMPIGSGAVLKSLDSVRGEFDKRLDPEIRKFLGAFARKALDRTANLMIDKGDSPKFVELRRAVARWLYEQPVGELATAVDAEAVALGREAGVLIAAHAATVDELSREITDVIGAFCTKHQTDPLAAVLAAYDVTYAPDLDALAEATWPLVRTAAKSATALDWASKVYGEFLAAGE